MQAIADNTKPGQMKKKEDERKAIPMRRKEAKRHVVAKKGNLEAVPEPKVKKKSVFKIISSFFKRPFKLFFCQLY